MNYNILILAIIGLLGFQVQAQSVHQSDIKLKRDEAVSKNNLQVGPAAVYASEIYEEADPTILPIPLVIAKWNNFFVEGVTAGYEQKLSNFTFRAFATFDSFMAYDDDTSDFLKGMDKRKSGANLGARLAYTFLNFHNIQIDAENDVTDASGGLKAQAAYKYTWMITPKIVNITSVGAKFYSEKYLNYYLGVDFANDNPTNTKLNLAGEYEFASGAVNPYLENTFFMNFNENWSALLLVSYESFASDIKDSPVVDQRGRSTVVMGPIYKF